MGAIALSVLAGCESTSGSGPGRATLASGTDRYDEQVLSPAADTTYWSPQAKVSPTNSVAATGFGTDVAMAGDRSRAVVGAAADSETEPTGSAYVVDDDGGKWSETTRLTADEPGQFGTAVALGGETVVVGAPTDGDGAGYVFHGADSDWNRQARLTLPGDISTAGLAESVALSAEGSVAVLGSADGGHVFERVDGTWAHESALQVQTGESETDVCVSGDGSTAVVCARRSGVFERTTDGWTRSTALGDGQTPSSAVAVSNDGTTVAVGSETGGDTGGNVRVYARSEGTWTDVATLTGATNRPDRFGESVSLSADGTTAVVGAFDGRTQSGEIDGAAYVFGVPDSEWETETRLTAPDGQSASFGFAVDTTADGTAAVVGAPSDDGNPGSAYVFSG